MKNYKSLYVILLLFSFIACSQEDPEITEYNDLQNTYTLAWIKSIGLIDVNQDWCMASLVKAEVKPSVFGNGCTICIYDARPEEGGILIGRTDKQTTLNLDVDKTATSVYVEVLDEARTVIGGGNYAITDGKVQINNAQPLRKVASRAGDDSDSEDAPANRFHWTIACEDLGAIGDFDFNDIVLGIYHVAGSTQLYITPLAAGGILATDIYVSPKPGNKFRSDVYVGEIHEMLSPGSSTSTLINTTNLNRIGGTRIVKVDEDWSISEGDFMGGIKLSVAGHSQPVSAPKAGAAPQMICVKGDWAWPSERTNIVEAYPKFKDWNNDASVTDWYKEVKAGTIINWSNKDSAPSVIDPSNMEFDPNFYIYLCTGQSNMEGFRTTIEDIDLANIPDRFLSMACVNFKEPARQMFHWYKAVPPLVREGYNVSPADWFGRTMCDHLPSNIRIGVVMVAVGNASLYHLDKDYDPSNITKDDPMWMWPWLAAYENQPYKRLVEAAKEAQKVGVIKGLLLHQGEAPADCGDINWPTKLNKLYTDLRTDLNIEAEDFPIFIGELVPTAMGGQHGYHNTTILPTVKAVIPNSYIISAEGLGHIGDNVHFSTESVRELGKRYAASALANLAE